MTTAGAAAARAPGPGDAPLSRTGRTTIRRHPERARTDRAELHAVLDAGMICHFAVVMDGTPLVLPTAYGRVGGTLYLHGSSANRSLRAADGRPVCVAVTHVDGLVCAGAAFSHSLNYRSAVVFGTGRLVTDGDERLLALRAVTDQVIPGRWDTLRPPTRKELAATCELAVPLAEASVKVRTGPQLGDPEDLLPGVWAGIVPVALAFGDPEPDPALAPGAAIPDHIRALARRGGAVA